MSDTWVRVLYLVAAVCFILALKGLSSPKTARSGNLIGAAGAVLAVVVTIIDQDLDGQHLVLILVAIALGTAVGVPAARGVAMTQMPQLVALFNGVGGAAAALVALIEFTDGGSDAPARYLAASAFTVLVGCVSFSGSVVTFLKLQELITTRPVIVPFGRWVSIGVAAAAVVLAVAVVPSGSTGVLVALALVSLVLGVLFVLPVGGADVPIVISLLNAFTGLTVAASGYVLNNVLLLVAGTLVGASGTLLTRMMATAMGRPLTKTLFGAFSGTSTVGGGTVSDRPVRSGSPEDVAILLAYARKVVIVPGYGLAVAQGQHTVRELADLLGGPRSRRRLRHPPRGRPDARTHDVLRRGERPR